MVKRYILNTFKFLFVDSTENILGDLSEQNWVMRGFIGIGWLAIVVMVVSFLGSLGTLIQVLFG